MLPARRPAAGRVGCRPPPGALAVISVTLFCLTVQTVTVLLSYTRQYTRREKFNIMKFYVVVVLAVETLVYF